MQACTIGHKPEECDVPDVVESRKRAVPFGRFDVVRQYVSRKNYKIYKRTKTYDLPPSGWSKIYVILDMEGKTNAIQEAHAGGDYRQIA